MIKKFITLAGIAMVAISANAQYPYKLISPIPNSQDGDVAYLIHFDTGEKVDSAVVVEGAVTFKGTLEEAFPVRLYCNGNRYGTFILEEGTTAVNQTTRRAVGSMLNDMANEINDSVSKIEEAYEKLKTDEERQALMDKYMRYMREKIAENEDNALGLLLFNNIAYDLDTPEFLAFLEEYPTLKQSQRVQSLMKSAQLKLETSEGKPYKDFEVTYDGTTKKLSDYVGNGKYTLVDFWASWCGPCVREIKTLKELNEAYKDKGLNVLGVAVWDEPENTKDAINRLQIPWDCILNSQNIATDIYGIPAIPCIILFGPDGTILSRGLQGEALKSAVSKYFE